LEEAHELGSTPALKARFNLNNARAALLTGPDLAGYEVVRKTKPKPFIGGLQPVVFESWSELLKAVECPLAPEDFTGKLEPGKAEVGQE
ncbi:hypothetical protein INQ30_27455, partial [Escherichia coli]|nr:hypothetical protein [Escherichia coli]